MSKPKPRLGEPEPDSRTHDDRGATKERLAKDTWEVGETGLVTIRRGPSPIERAVNRGTLTLRQGDAAKRFYDHWQGALTYRVSSAGDLLRVFGTDSDFASATSIDIAISHHQKCKEAQQVVRAKVDAAGARGDHAVKLLELVICREVPFLAAGEAIGFRDREAEIMARTLMRSSLNVLIMLWGL